MSQNSKGAAKGSDKKKKGASKNQPNTQRSAENERIAALPTRHLCMSATCPTPKQHILNKDLLTAVAAMPKRKKLYYHKSCYNSR